MQTNNDPQQNFDASEGNNINTQALNDVKSANENEEITKSEQKTSNDAKSSHSDLSEPIIIGFKTAGGRTLAPTTESLEKASKMLETPITPVYNTYIKTNNVENSEINHKKMEIQNTINENIESNTTELQDTSKNTINDEPTSSNAEIKQNPELMDEKLNTGFTTASGKQLNTPSQELLEKAKKLLSNDISNENSFELTTENDKNPIEAADKSQKNTSKASIPDNFSGFQTASGKVIQPSEESIKNASAKFNEDIQQNVEKFIGFTAASGKKPIEPSEESMMKAAALFGNNNTNPEESVKNNSSTTEEFVGFSTASGRAINPSEESLRHANAIFGNENSSKSEEYVGFTTASGRKPIEPSKESMKKAAALFSAANNQINQNDTSKKEEFVGFSTARGKAINPSEESMKKSAASFGEENLGSNSEFVGFTTASGKKPIEPSEESMKKATNMFNDGFSTANGKSISISEESMRKAANMFGEENSKQEFVGFTTASGKKPIELSEESMKKAANLFNENTGQQESEGLSGFSTASGKSLKPSEESMKKAANMFGEYENQTIGFSTARGKSINPSEESMKKAANMFGDDSLQKNDNFAGFSTASGKKPIEPSAEAMKRAAALFGDDQNKLNEEFVGFSTASGKKPIQPSEESIRKAANLFNDYNTTPDAETFTGFSTANGKKQIQPSDEAMKRAANMFGDDSLQKNDSFVGFSTANGKKQIVPSEDSLRKASNMFNDENNSTKTETFVGFSTAHGRKPIEPSEAALKRAANLFNDNEQSNEGFVGFSTANGKKPIEPSEAAMKRAANLFNEESNESFASFSTANGKMSVNPSEESLKKAAENMAEDSRPKLKPKTSISHPSQSEFPKPSLDDISQRSSQSSNRTPNRTTFIASPSPSSFKFSPSGAALSAYMGTSPMATPQRQTVPRTPQPIRQSPTASTPQIPGKKPFRPPTMSKTAPATPSKENKMAKIDKQAVVFELPSIKRETLQIYAKYHGVPKREYDPYEFTSDDALSYRFPDHRGVNDIFVALLENKVEPILLKPSWVRNHYKWIVWKLMCLDLSYKEINAANDEKLLTFDNVLNEMLYRVQRELYDAKRSAVKMIHERDAPPNAFLILAVSKIVEDGVVELTDGWYSINGALDLTLNSYLLEGKIAIGDKLRICGATLDGDDACDPLESKASSTRLMLRANGVRRAKWHARLGYQQIALFPVNIKSLVPNGGVAPFIEVVIQKRLPMLFREAKTDGNAVIRNQQMQSVYERQTENQMQNDLEKARVEWQKELDEDGTDSMNEYPKLKAFLQSGDQTAFMAGLNAEEKKELEGYVKRHEKEVDEFFRNYTEEFIKDYTAECTPFFSVQATDLCPYKPSDCEITFWRPPMELYEALQEGNCVRIYHIESSESKGNRLVSKGSPHVDIITPQPRVSSFIRRKRCYVESLGELWKLGVLGLSTGTLVDIAGFVFLTENNCLFLVDGGGVLACIEIRLYQPEEILAINGLVFLENVRYQSLDEINGIILLSANESTIFNRAPSKSNRLMWDSYQALKQQIDFKKYQRLMKRIVQGQKVRLHKQATDLTVTKPLCQIVTVCPFDRIESIKGSDDKTIIIFGLSPDESFKESIVSNSFFNSGLNLLMKVNDGIGSSYLRINSLTVYKFFVALSTQISQTMKNRMISFFDEFFCKDGYSEGDNLGYVRNKIMSNFQIDTKAIETVTRVLIYHGTVVYDEKNVKQILNKIAVNPIFPFRADEWMQFAKLLSDALNECEFQIEHFPGDNGENIIINASSIAAVDNNAAVSELMRYLL